MKKVQKTNKYVIDCWYKSFGYVSDPKMKCTCCRSFNYFGYSLEEALSGAYFICRQWLDSRSTGLGYEITSIKVFEN